MKKLCRIQSVPIQKEIEVGDIVKYIKSDPNLDELYTNNKYVININHQLKESIYWQPQKLLLLSDEEIKEGDWCYINLDENSRVTKIISLNGTHPIFNIEIEEGYAILSNLKKIIASYPQLDKLPTFSKEFIQQWVNDPIEEVEVEYANNSNEAIQMIDSLKVGESLNNGLKLQNNEVICNARLHGNIKFIDSLENLNEGKSILDCSKIERHDFKSKEVQPVGNSDSKETWEKEVDKEIELAAREYDYLNSVLKQDNYHAFIAGANSNSAKNYWQKGMYTEEEVKGLYLSIRNKRNELRDEFERSTNYPEFSGIVLKIKGMDETLTIFEQWFEQHKKK